MQTLLTLLPALLCPLSMVAMIWLMHRDSKDGKIAEPVSLVSTPQHHATRPFVGSLGRWFQCCMNWKVGLGLALVGVGIWVVQPALVGAALPFLVILLCPLSMLLMRWGGHREPQSAPPTEAPMATAYGTERAQHGQGSRH